MAAVVSDVVSVTRKLLTLAFIRKEDKLLLGLKKRGFGAGLWNGFGGKVDEGEDIVDATAREIEEECGLKVEPSDLKKFAVIDFEFADDPVILEVHAFSCSKFTGEVIESEEMLPRWYPCDKLPHDKMWPDDVIWYPLYLKGAKFRAFFYFEDYSKILSYKIRDFDNDDIVLLEKKLEE